MSSKKKQKESLQYVQLNDFALIPEDIMKRFTEKYDIDYKVLYKHNQMIFAETGSMLYLMKNKKFEVKGFIWTSVNLLEKVIYINYVVIDDDVKEMEYKEIAKQMKEVMKNSGFKKVMWLSDEPEALETAGFSRSDRTLMELK